MSEDSGKPDAAEARRMLDICASVGATAVDVTWTTSANEPRRYDEDVGLADFGRSLPGILDTATRQRRNVIIRPHGPGVTLLQLDDLTTASHQIAISPMGGLAFGTRKLTELAAESFGILETSPGSFQAWLAFQGRLDKDYARRVRKGTGADTGASGATRIPGSFNFKAAYAPEKTGRPTYPLVTIRAAQPERMTTAAKLQELGLVAPEEHFTPLPSSHFEADRLRQWPDYQYNLDRASPKQTGDGLDLSGVDFVWCMTASTWGFDVKDIADELMIVSEHARHPSNGINYARRTAERAAGAVERRRERKAMRHLHG
jgi:hypothetical protein